MTTTRLVLALFTAAIASVGLTADQDAPSASAAAGPVRPATVADISVYYDIENIALPDVEPSADGVAVMPDGRVVVAFYNGSVWFYEPRTKVWSTFAEGLHTPLGVLPLSNREVLVMQMPELTLLVDRDGDGRADLYRTVSDDFGLSGNYAEFAFGPVRDAEGNLFFSLGTGSNMGAPLTSEVRGFLNPLGAWGRMTSPVPYRGWIMKVTPDGTTIPWAAGLREPNGLGLDPQGRLFAIDNQGDWVGSGSFYRIEQGKFYGHVPDLVWREDFQGGKQPLDAPVAELDRLRTRAAVTIPYGDMSNSPTQPVWDTTAGRFGPFTGQAFLGEMNQQYLMRLMLEDVDGQTQGAVTPFLRDSNRPQLSRGNNRLAFDQQGNLWVGQTLHRGWTGQTGLQRVSWKGVLPLDVVSMTLTDNGFDLAFTRPVHAEAAGNPASYAMKSYFYNYHEGYGSAKFDNRPVPITGATVSADRRRVRLTVDRLEAWRLYDLTMTGLVSEDRQHPLLSNWVVYTLNHLRRGTPPPPAPIPQPPTTRRTPRFPSSSMQSIGGPQDFKPLPPS
jgi:glucose/arabinose dehydrogenase